MNLEDFVKQTLLQISNGAIQANDQLTKTGGLIPDTDMDVPESTPVKTVYDGTIVNGRHVQRLVIDIDFDIAVSVNESNTDTIGGGLTVASFFSAGTNSENKNESTAVNRIKFRLPLVLPKTNSKKADKLNGKTTNENP